MKKIDYDKEQEHPSKRFSDHLKYLMETKNKTVRQLSRDTGISPSYISLLRQGLRGEPSLGVLERLVENLNLGGQEKLDFYLSANRIPFGNAEEWLKIHMSQLEYENSNLRELVEEFKIGELEKLIENGIISTVLQGIKKGEITNYGKFLRKIRKEELDISQTQVMYETGIPGSLISHMESESQSPSLETLSKVAKFYGVDKISRLLLKEYLNIEGDGQLQELVKEPLIEEPETKSFRARLNELPKELGKDWDELEREMGISAPTLSRIKEHLGDVTLSTIEKIGYGLGLIPVVFYRESDGLIEDLEIEEFVSGKRIDNYVGQAFRKHRKLSKLTQKEFGEKLGISFVHYGFYEHGKTRPLVKRLERISTELNLVPSYLFRPITYIDRNLQPIIKLLENLSPSSLRDLNDNERRKLIEYSNKAYELVQALREKI